MPIERIPIESREQWLALRRQDVTASVAGALLGTSPFITAYALWAVKKGLVKEDNEETPAMRRGRHMEKSAIDWLREDRPDLELRAPGAYYRDPARRLGATPDLFAVDRARGIGIVQIKSVEPFIFRREWQIDDTTGLYVPPLWIAVQAIVEAVLTNAEWAAVYAYRVGYTIEADLIDVPIHQGVIDAIYAATGEFWERIKNDQPPPPEYGRDADVLAQIYATDDGTTVDLRGDNEAITLFEERRAISQAKAAGDKRATEIKGELLHKIGNATHVLLPGGASATAKTIRRAGYQVPPTEYRDLRFKPAKGGE